MWSGYLVVVVFFLFACALLQKGSRVISTNHCGAQQLLNSLLLLAFGSVFLEREKGDTAHWSLSRVIKAGDGKDLPSSRSTFLGKWKHRMCVYSRHAMYIALNVRQSWMVCSLTGVSPLFKIKGVWRGRELGVINLIYLNSHFRWQDFVYLSSMLWLGCILFHCFISPFDYCWHLPYFSLHSLVRVFYLHVFVQAVQSTSPLSLAKEHLIYPFASWKSN